MKEITKKERGEELLMLKAIEGVSVEEGGSSKDNMWIDGENNNSLGRA